MISLSQSLSGDVFVQDGYDQDCSCRQGLLQNGP